MNKRGGVVVVVLVVVALIGALAFGQGFDITFLFDFFFNYFFSYIVLTRYAHFFLHGNSIQHMHYHQTHLVEDFNWLKMVI